jgi:hypothetical protein
MSDASALTLPKPPPLTLGKFDQDDFPDWMHTAQRFFVQYKLWDIITGETPNPAGDVEPSVTSGKIDLGERVGPTPQMRFLRGEPDPQRPHEVAVYKWNERHSLAYNYLLDSVKPDRSAYSRIVGCKTAADAWKKLVMQYGARSDAKLSLLEERLHYLKKTPETMMNKHIDDFSNLIEQIQFHLPLDRRWDDETVNRRFIRTLDQKEWLPWIRALGPNLKRMTPVELYADILLDDEVMHGKPAAAETKEASLAARIGGKGGQGGNGSKRGRRSRNKGKRQHRAQPAQSYDGYVYDGRRPSDEYVKLQKQRKGADYRECQFCSWPGHYANDCRKLQALKAKDGSKQQATSQKSNDGFAPASSSSGKFLTWEASITELVASATEMCGEHVWGLDSHANVHLSPYRHRFINYRELDRPEQVAGWHGAPDTVVGVGSVDMVGKNGRRYRLPQVYYAPTARKQLLSEGQLLMYDDLIRTYDRNSYKVDNFGLESSDGEFQMDGKIIDLLFYVFEARTSHQAYAVTRSATRNQREALGDDDGDVGGENFLDGKSIMEGGSQEPIRSEDLSHLTSIQPIRGPEFSHLTAKSPQPPQPPQPPPSPIESPTPQPQNNGEIDPSIDDATLWHNRLGHRAISTLQKARIVPKSAQIRPCKACVEGKQTKLPYRRYEHNAKHTLWRVHSDMSGMSIPSIKTNYRYFVTFIDDFSRYAWVYFTDRKDAKSIREVFEPWKADAENKSNNKVSFLQTDEGGEYENVMRQLLDQTGITHLASPPYSHESNGLAERLNRTLKDAARTMMIHANLPDSFWAKAMVQACEIYNMLPHDGIGGKTPYEVFWEMPVPSLNRYKVFGCIIEPHIPKEVRPPESMWDKRAYRAVYVGTDSRSGYEFWDLRNRRFDHAHNCTFFEDEFPTSEDFPQAEQYQRRRRGEKRIPPKPTVIAEPERPKSPAQPMLDTIVVERGPPPSPPPPHESNAAQSKMPVNDRPSLEEALSSPEAPKWRAAMLEELRSIDENKVWQLHLPPPNGRALGSKWVLTVKRDAQGNIERYKARLVVQGFGQQFGFDYDETYSPVIRIDNVRVIFAIGAHFRHYGVDIWHIDFRNAFQNGEADFPIFIRQPPGFTNPQYPNHVLLLLKSLYGLKQASRIWFMILCQLILDLGFTACQTDQCTFYSNDRRLLIAVYVDDLLMVGKPEDNQRCVNELSKRFKLRNHGPVKSFLGLNVTYDNGGIQLNQIGYIHRKAQEFGLTNAKPYDNPLDPSLPLVHATPDDKLVDPTSYQELTGSLNHLAITSRPDIAFAVSKLCQFNSKPTFTHLKAARRVLRYAIHTRDYSLKYCGDGSSVLQLLGFADADYGSNLIDRKSTTGYIFILCCGPISWQSRKQPTVAMSTMEAEYMALSDAIRELLSRMYYITELGISTIQPTVMYSDNQAAIALSDGEGDYRRAKHIDIRYHFIRDHLQRGTVEINYIPSEKQPADILTKALPTSKHNACITALHLGQ